MFFFLSFCLVHDNWASIKTLSAGYGKINLYVAVEQMKRITIPGYLSIKFRKWNRQTRDGGDMVILTAARLRKKATDESIENSSYKLFLTDTTTGRPLNCWECLVMEFNGKRITI